jgi:excisionase family DNA binding protein
MTATAKSDRRKRELRASTASLRPPASSTDSLPDTSGPPDDDGAGGEHPGTGDQRGIDPEASSFARIGHNRGPPFHEVEPLAVRPSIAWRLLDCGNTHGYELLAAGELESYQDGRSRRITMRSIKAYIARRVAADRPTSPTDGQPRRRGRPRKRADAAVAP